MVDCPELVRSSSVEAKMKRPANKSGGIKAPSTFSTFVIQKYIEKPLLYKGYKFDIRVFALFTHRKEVYVFKYIIVILVKPT